MWLRASIPFVVLLAACGSAGPPSTTVTTPANSPNADDGCAHVLEVRVESTNGDYRVEATVLSSDTGWDKYADAWEVRTPDGAVLGVRELAHPHENEQPFTRSLSGVAIPDDVTEVVVAAHDSVTGFCGTVFRAPVPTEPQS